MPLEIQITLNNRRFMAMIWSTVLLDCVGSPIAEHRMQLYIGIYILGVFL